MWVNNMKLKSQYIKFLMNGMTYEDLSDKSDVSKTWLVTVINRGHASMNVVNKIAKALEVDPIEIVKLED